MAIPSILICILTEETGQGETLIRGLLSLTNNDEFWPVELLNPKPKKNHVTETRSDFIDPEEDYTVYAFRSMEGDLFMSLGLVLEISLLLNEGSYRGNTCLSLCWTLHKLYVPCQPFKLPFFVYPPNNLIPGFNILSPWLFSQKTFDFSPIPWLCLPFLPCIKSQGRCLQTKLWSHKWDPKNLRKQGIVCSAHFMTQT